MLRRLLRWSGLAAAALAAAVVLLRLAFPLPAPVPGRTDPPAPPVPASAPLTAAVSAETAAHPGLSGVYPLVTGRDAFAARILLARGAAATIDAQYYIWQNDLTGIRLLAELDEAARRGVRVRLLVDDNGTPDLDTELAALDALPMAEVRLFNPFVLRAPRGLNYAFDFFRLNRRMHNKSFTVDGAATIVGGRNIGDVYFDTGAGHTYLDLDALAIGPAAAEVGADFARYWDSPLAIPVSALVDAGATDAIAVRDAALRATPQATAYSEAVRASETVAQLEAMTLPLDWGRVMLFSDDPAKAEGSAAEDDLLMRRMMTEIGEPRISLDLVSAYFVPGPQSSDRFADFASRGVAVRVLTNALEATDVVPVHAGYATYRDTLVDGGVRLFELRSDTGERRTVDELGILRISKAALHAKSFQVDGERAFIGSMNFDPRSKRLNTEMGLLIDSPRLAGLISGWMEGNLPDLAYEVGRGADGGLTWTLARPGADPLVYDVEPNTSAPLRLLVRIIGLLPVEWLL